MKKQLASVLVILSVLFRLIEFGISSAQGDPNEKYRIYESNTGLFSISWANDGASLVFQERFYDNIADRQIDGVDTEGTDTWNQHFVNTQQNLKSDFWPLQPDLTPTQYANYEISVEDYTPFAMISPNNRFIAYSGQSTGQPYLPLGIADLQNNQHVIFENTGIDTIVSIKDERVYWSADSSAFIYLERTQGGNVRVYYVSGLEDLDHVQILQLHEMLFNELSYYVELVFGIDAGGDRVLLGGFPEHSSSFIIWNVNTHQFVDIPIGGPVAGAAFWGEDQEYVMFVDTEGLKRFEIGSGRVILVNPNINSGWARGGVYFSPDMRNIAIHNGGEPVRDGLYVIPIAEGGTNLALFRTDTHAATLLQTLDIKPAPIDYYTYATGAPLPTNSSNRWVMGDWDGDGVETPGVYITSGASAGVFYHTDVLGPTSSWTGTWFGLTTGTAGNRPVAGRFSSAGHDCIGVTDSADFPPYGTAFVLYYTCDLNGGNPPKTAQWLSTVLSDVKHPELIGHPWQFGAGDFDGDGVETIACRRYVYIAWTNTHPDVVSAAFPFAQYWGSQGVADEGHFIVGDWDDDGVSSFGGYYANGWFVGRNDLLWNDPQYVHQEVGTPLGTVGLSVTSWRLR